MNKFLKGGLGIFGAIMGLGFAVYWTIIGIAVLCFLGYSFLWVICWVIKCFG